MVATAVLARWSPAVVDVGIPLNKAIETIGKMIVVDRGDVHRVRSPPVMLYAQSMRRSIANVWRGARKATPPKTNRFSRGAQINVSPKLLKKLVIDAGVAERSVEVSVDEV